MRLIDADALYEEVFNDLRYRGIIEHEDFDVIINYLDAAPTIEVKPELSEQWIDREKLLKKIDEIFDRTDVTGTEQIGVLLCRKAIREMPSVKSEVDK